jgi:DNA uptake protein ComE-like DNA-binding protein
MSKPRRSSRSHWAYVSLVPFGLGAWVPIYAGEKLNRRSWILWGTLWTLITLAGWVVAIASNGGSAGGLLIILGWAGAVATSFSIRRAYDAELASPLEEAAEQARGRVADRERARRIAERQPALAKEIGIGRPDVLGAADAGLVDVNNASVTALLKLPGIDGDLATRIVETREHVDGFSSLEDCGAVLDMDGGIVEGLRGRVVFLPRS